MTNTAMAPADQIRERHVNMYTAFFGLIAGAVVFLPSIIGVLKPPFVADFLLLVFWLVGAVSLVALCITIYLLRYTTVTKRPDELSGVGVWCGVISLVCLVTYVTVNGFQDRLSKPSVDQVEVSPPVLEPGGVATLTAKASDEDQDQLSFVWTFNGRQFGKYPVAYWQAPHALGLYEVMLRVDDGDSRHATEVTVPVRVSTKERTMASNRTPGENEDAAILTDAAILQGLDRIRQTNRKQFDELYSAYADSKLPGMVAAQFSPKDPRAYNAIMPDALESAVRLLPEEALDQLIRGVRLPPCKDYPGLWPFCTKD